MNNLSLNYSSTFNFSVIKKLYSNKDDLSLAFPSASFPIVEGEWNNWINKNESKNYSLEIKLGEEVISHIAIKNYEKDPGICYLCFFIIDREFRSKSLAKSILKLAYGFVRNELSKNELWLVVDPSNSVAYNLYKSENFKQIDQRSQGLRLKKNL